MILREKLDIDYDCDVSKLREGAVLRYGTIEDDDEEYVYACFDYRGREETTFGKSEEEAYLMAEDLWRLLVA